MFIYLLAIIYESWLNILPPPPHAHTHCRYFYLASLRHHYYNTLDKATCVCEGNACLVLSFLMQG